MVFFRTGQYEGVSLSQAKAVYDGLTNDQVRVKAVAFSNDYKSKTPSGFGVSPTVTIRFLSSDFGKQTQRILGFANWGFDMFLHKVNADQIVEQTPEPLKTRLRTGGILPTPIPSPSPVFNGKTFEESGIVLDPSDFAPEQPTTSPDEDQFLHQPTDIFEAIGIQGESLPQPTGKLLLKMNQTQFPAISETFGGVNGTVTFEIASGVDPRVFGSSGRNFVFRVLIHNLTGTDRTERRINFSITQAIPLKRVKYLVAIPTGSQRIRVELQAFTDKGLPASNVFNETHIKKGVTPPPVVVPPISERECNCRGVIKKVRIGEPCPVCKELPPPIEKQGIFASIGFDTLIIGGLAVAALMPRGDKKK